MWSMVPHVAHRQVDVVDAEHHLILLGSHTSAKYVSRLVERRPQRQGGGIEPADEPLGTTSAPAGR
jgi:hypothetical protein